MKNLTQLYRCLTCGKLSIRLFFCLDCAEDELEHELSRPLENPTIILEATKQLPRSIAL